jgi:hypothetical protein
MFKNKYVLIALIFAVFAIILIYVLIGKKERELSPVIHAVPTNPLYILETEDLPFLSHKVLRNKNLSSILSEFELTKGFFGELYFIDSLINNNKEIKQFLNNQTVVISSHVLGQNDIEYLFITGSVKNKKNREQLKEILQTIDSNTQFENISFAGAEIVKFSPAKKNEIYYTFFEDYFLISKSEIVLQRSIKNINSGANLFTNTNFKKLFKNSKKNIDARLYLHYQNFFKAYRNRFNSAFADKLVILSNFADWTALDVSVNRKDIKMNGHTTLKPEIQYLSLVKNVQPRKVDLLSILPEKTSAIIQMNIGKGTDFRYVYEDFMANINKLNDHQIQIAEFHNRFNIDIDLNSLYNYVDDEIALIYEDVNKTGKDHNSYLLIEVNNIDNAKDFLSKITEIHIKKHSLNQTAYKHVFSYDSEYTIERIPVKNIPELYFGSIFSSFNAEYYTFIKDFLIFAETENEIKDFIESYMQDKTFKRKSNAYDLIKSHPSQSNVFLYIDIVQSSEILSNIFTKDNSKTLLSQKELIKSIQGPIIQFISDSYPLYTTFTISLEKEKREQTETVWEVRLDTIIATKPSIILNHNTEEKEIVIQDAANKLYLINKNGEILWTRQLDGKIMSDIEQIDFYENNKLQIVFNTENNIYCIDRNGNWLEGFPVKLKSKATNGLSLIDYDKNKNYRMLIATNGNRVYLYDKTGKLIDGWEFEKTAGKVTQKIKLFQNNGKDYLVFRDNTNIYILNRRGQERVKLEVNFSLSQYSEVYFSKSNSFQKAHFCITNPAGTVFKIYEDGKIEQKELKKYSSFHYFIYEDINGDGINDYIFTDNNRTEVFNGKDEKRIFIKNFNTDISYNPNVYVFSESDVRLGTSSGKKIFLIDNTGEMIENFPLTGAGMFSITNFDQSGVFSLIVGNNDNYLYKYNIK